VTDHNSVKGGIVPVIHRYGALHILHNNVGGSTNADGPVTEAPDSEFWRCMTVDLFGTFLCSKYGIPEIIKARGGSVINMSSNVALMAVPGRDCYTAAKEAIASMTRSMAVECAPYKIRVNAIAPSMTLTARVQKQFDTPGVFSDAVRELAGTHLLGPGQPIHIANMALYLASDESEITTGQIKSVDSGVTIY
jgi:NAD(P)-dependent dehydrogenase (short-subunit alcohol dehydrogenase family)